MNLVTTFFVIVLSGMFLWGYTELQASHREEQAVSATIDGVTDLQTAFYRWVATRPQDANEYTIPDLDDVRRFSADFWPRDALTQAAPTAGEVAPGTFVVTGVRHGGGETIGLRWVRECSDTTFVTEAACLAASETWNEGNEVQMHLLGRWDPLRVARLQGVLPYVQQEQIDPEFGGPIPGSLAMRIDMIHPGSSASLSSVVRRFGTGDGGEAEGMQTPLVFGDGGRVNANEPCGLSGALAVDAQGMPMGCMDVDNDNTREWTPIMATSVYCRQATAAAGSPEFRRNMPGALPVIEVTLDNYTTPVQNTRVIRILGVITGGDTLCPEGFTAVDPGVTDECEVEVRADGTVVP
ncbi:MAG: hypothetical protein F4Z82_15945 [Caldilineaceae bacterium SB0668_bin_21]|nr:hypothetical protein [Caldilineaceae bacterium SB0668_bin_21]MYI35166.1 hypothetical protein [Acidimicrobiaceae bacterium]